MRMSRKGLPMERVHAHRQSMASQKIQPLRPLRASSKSLIQSLAEFRGPGVHHRIDDSPDDIDMDLDSRFRPNNGLGSRIILLGDGTELTTEAPDSEMFDNDNEDKDLDSQVDKSKVEGSNGTAGGREETPGPQAKSLQAVADSPSSVKTEKSEGNEPPPGGDKVTTQSGKPQAGTAVGEK